jgi:hypothetical protein
MPLMGLGPRGPITLRVIPVQGHSPSLALAAPLTGIEPPRPTGGYRLDGSGSVTAYLKPTCESTKPSRR